jgi:hypothetical protein
MTYEPLSLATMLEDSKPAGPPDDVPMFLGSVAEWRALWDVVVVPLVALTFDRTRIANVARAIADLILPGVLADLGLRPRAVRS